MTRALYTGSFDPMTNGHLDIITRASKMFSELVVGVIVNPSKSPLFTKEERVSMIEDVVRDIRNVRVDCFQGLLAHYVNDNSFDAVVRGLRATTDFEYEIQMAQIIFVFVAYLYHIFVLLLRYCHALWHIQQP